MSTKNQERRLDELEFGKWSKKRTSESCIMHIVSGVRSGDSGGERVRM